MATEKSPRNIFLILKNAVIDLYNHIGYSMLISIIWFISVLPLGMLFYNSFIVYLKTRDNPFNLLIFLLLFGVPYSAFIFGPVQAALVYQMDHVIVYEAEIKGLWLGFRKFYWRAAAVYGLYMGAVIFVLIDLLICFVVVDNLFIKFIGFFLLYLLIFLLLTSFYLPSFIVFQDNNWKKVFKKTLLLTLDNTLYTILVQLVLLVIGVLCTIIAPLLFLFYGGFLQVMGIRVFWGLLEKYPDPPASQVDYQSEEKS
jgi:uncharacterized membrane protein YesL